MAKHGRDAGKERFWRGVVAKQRKGKLSIRAFCKLQGLQEASFYSWRRELALREQETRAGVPVKSVSSLFVPVCVRRDEGAERRDDGGAGIDVVLAGGRVVRVRRGFDRDTLREVVAALEDRPC